MRFFLGKRVGPFFLGVSQRVKLSNAALVDFVIAVALLVLALIVCASRP